MTNSNNALLNDVTFVEKDNKITITNEEYEHILNLQHEVLLLSASKMKTQDILDKICQMLESMLSNAVASLMLKNQTDGLIYVQSAPSVPQAGWSALNGIRPGPHSGSCGNAVYHGEPQYIVNAFTDERGSDFLQTAKAFNLCSCWSMPIKDENIQTIGSIALSSFEHRSPVPFHKKLLKTASSLVSIVLKNEEKNRQIENMLYQDNLTALKNKFSLQQHLNDGLFYTIIFLDINNFSYINTAYGFKIGDKILIEISKQLQELFPQNLYRLNADQFAIKFQEKIDIEETIAVIKQTFIEKTINVGEIKLKISFSYGGVYANKNLLQCAAFAIKKAKEKGKNILYIFNEDIDNTDNRKLFISMNHSIYTAFENKLFIPYFQGLYHNGQNSITKFEALVRMKATNGEILSPYKFLDVAKLSGLLPKLTRVMIDETFKIMSTLPYSFSINITEDDLSLQYLVEYLQLKSTQYKIEPYRVTLEILEGVSATEQRNNTLQLKELKRKGYKLAIDDFGAEYSNFERVLELDIDVLKIDARYIKNIDKDKKSYEIVKSIVNFSKSMYITTVAEFVHSASVQKTVLDLGINYSQGFFFSEPTQEVNAEPLNLLTKT